MSLSQISHFHLQVLLFGALKAKVASPLLPVLYNNIISTVLYNAVLFINK